MEIDETCLALVRVRDPEAWRRLYETTHRGLLVYLHAILQDWALADDALQETFLQAWRSIHRFRSDAPFPPWIHRVARNVALQIRRASVRRHRHEHGRPEELFEPGDADAERREEYRQVEAALARLCPNEREILTLRVLSGLSPPEVAGILGIPTGTVLSRTHTALGRVRESLRCRDALAPSGKKPKIP
ncbi:MAG: sigma-70 family RNA polymerase sigma factor [Planctomycetes bacterium]|nr:sigma-70 family RNA polymerase sigma factor [Planctomycetota bacterium]